MEGQGMIQGGWGYVIAAYGISWGVLALYVVSLFQRARGLRSSGEAP
jgi:CcmD family protein